MLGVRLLLAGVLVLLLGLLGRLHRCALLLLVHDEAMVAFFAIPLEASEVGSVELIIGLESKPESAGCLFRDGPRQRGGRKGIRD